MKRILLIVAIVSTFNFQLSTCRAESGDDAYRKGDYETAVERYEAVLATGYASADLYYNLGNAYYRTHQMGLAILNYERALRLEPSMSDARENLALAESKTVDRITPLPKLFIVRWVDVLCTHITPAAWRVVWLVLLALVCLSVATMRLAPRRSLRKSGFIVGMIGILLLVVVTLLLISSTRRYNAHSQAVVLQPAITVKSSPEVQSTDKLVLHEGTKLTVSDSLEGWYKITIADGTTGWCRTADIERI